MRLARPRIATVALVLMSVFVAACEPPEESGTVEFCGYSVLGVAGHGDIDDVREVRDVAVDGRRPHTPGDM